MRSCRNAAQVIVLRVEPCACLRVVSADERVEGTVQAEKEEGELSFSAMRIESAAAFQPGNERLAGADDLGQLLVSELQPAGRRERGFRQDGSLLRGRAGEGGYHAIAR